MIRGEDIVAEARTWLDTPFHHQGRMKGIGADCAGLLIGVANSLKLMAHDVRGYSRIPDGRMLQVECDRAMLRVPRGQVRAGDALLFRMGRYPQHLGFVTAAEAGEPRSFIHIYSEDRGCCIEHIVDAKWRRRIIQAYRFPGVA